MISVCKNASHYHSVWPMWNWKVRKKKKKKVTFYIFVSKLPYWRAFVSKLPYWNWGVCLIKNNGFRGGDDHAPQVRRFHFQLFVASSVFNVSYRVFPVGRWRDDMWLLEIVDLSICSSMDNVQHQPFENCKFPNHSSNSETLRRIREEQPQEKEEKDEQASSSSSLALATTHQDEAAVLHALVASSLFNGLPTVTLFLIMGFVDSVDGGLSRLMSLSSSMHRVVNILLERLSNQVSFAVTTSGRRC